MNVQLQPGALPVGYCYPSNPQTFYNDIFSLAVALFPDTFGSVVVSDVAPAIGGVTKVWVRTAGGNPYNPLLWVPYNGAWASPHPVNPLSKVRQIWVGAEDATLWGYEGGDGTNNPATPITGPMWVVDHTLDARMILGAGTLPSGLVIINGTTGGEEKHVLTAAESVPHTHLIPFKENVNAGNNPEIQGDGKATNPEMTIASKSALGNASGGTDGHNTMPPYYGVYFIKRTARVYYS